MVNIIFRVEWVGTVGIWQGIRRPTRALIFRKMENLNGKPQSKTNGITDEKLRHSFSELFEVAVGWVFVCALCVSEADQAISPCRWNKILQRDDECCGSKKLFAPFRPIGDSVVQQKCHQPKPIKCLMAFGSFFCVRLSGRVANPFTYEVANDSPQLFRNHRMKMAGQLNALTAWQLSSLCVEMGIYMEKADMRFTSFLCMPLLFLCICIQISYRNLFMEMCIFDCKWHTYCYLLIEYWIFIDALVVGGVGGVFERVIQVHDIS